MWVLRRLWSRKYVVTCPDGTTRTVYYRIEDVFPLQLTHARRSATASISGLQKLKASAELKNDQRLAAVLAGIDRINQSMQTHFRAAYAVYEISPCTELPYFKAAVEKIIVDEQRLRAVETVVAKACEVVLSRPKGAPIDAALSAMVDQRLSQAMEALLPSPAANLVHEMSKVGDRTARWSGNG